MPNSIQPSSRPCSGTRASSKLWRCLHNYYAAAHAVRKVQPDIGTYQHGRSAWISFLGISNLSRSVPTNFAELDNSPVLLDMLFPCLLSQI
uniref:Uncharacterized protein n=1 Tax=Dunaliella tertiolecta TaxID=3047 RepID=A0A7S3QWH3_DUNTE